MPNRRLYLSEKNHEKWLKALTPFLENAETSSTARSAPLRFSGGDKEKLRAVRASAQATRCKYKNAKGEEVTLGERGRIPDEIVKAYDAAH